MPLEVGQRLGDYEVQQMLGVGGMGHVYRVRNIISNRTEAMKVLLPDLTAEPDLATRFISEIRTLASFDHPNIAQLHTALIAENQLIMMMEYVEGYTLEQLAKQRNMPVGEVAGYISQSLSALAYAHSHGVVHRDVKPANLMVTSHGIIKLMDFGIAKSNVENNNHTRPGTTLGSLYYMSPEQVRGDTVDARSDIYSVGIVLYELLAGRRPFEAETTFTILNKQLNEQPQPPIELNPAIPAGLNGIILMALSKDPDQRFQNADAFRNALKSYCASPGTHEVAAPVASVVAAALAAANAPASATSFGAPAASATPPPAAAAPPPAYAAIPQAPPPESYASAKPPRSNKPLWIATGAIAAVLALVAVGVAVPHWMKTHAAASTTTASATPPQDLPALPPPPGDTPASTPPANDSQSLPAGISSSQGASAQPNGGSSEELARAKDRKQAEERKQEQARVVQQAADQAAAAQAAALAAQQEQLKTRRVNGGGGGERMQPGNPQHEGAEALGQVQERMIDMDARATTARRQVGQIRKQQEADGLGLRNDVESAESRLDAYLRAAKGDVERGDAMAARQDLNKAEPELNTLERFLGH
jgi:eukaryotic-like serine/threonine-protein kinase